MDMTTFDMMEYGWILAWDSEAGCVVTWNGCSTYNFWVTGDDGVTWKNTDVRTWDPYPNSEFPSLGEAATYSRAYIREAVYGEEE